jgi:hypothetical protein
MTSGFPSVVAGDFCTVLFVSTASGFISTDGVSGRLIRSAVHAGSASDDIVIDEASIAVKAVTDSERCQLEVLLEGIWIFSSNE